MCTKKQKKKNTRWLDGDMAVVYGELWKSSLTRVVRDWLLVQTIKNRVRRPHATVLLVVAFVKRDNLPRKFG